MTAPAAEPRRLSHDSTNRKIFSLATASIRADSRVLDLGAGTGVHGLMAARLGAKRVYLVEPENIISVAEEIVRSNGLEHVVRCLQGRIEEVQLPEPVDDLLRRLRSSVAGRPQTNVLKR